MWLRAEHRSADRANEILANIRREHPVHAGFPPSTIQPAHAGVGFGLASSDRAALARPDGASRAGIRSTLRSRLLSLPRKYSRGGGAKSFLLPNVRVRQRFRRAAARYTRVAVGC